MGFVVPFINRDIADVRANIRTKITEEQIQKRLVLVIVSIALLLDNMLYMVIVPIIPMYLRKIGAYSTKMTCDDVDRDINGTCPKADQEKEYVGEDEELGLLFASKAALQLIVNPFSGTLIDRIGYEIPMMIGLIVMFCSTSLFALGRSYGLLFFARCIQGFGSAFADTAGLAMIADRFTEEKERSKALGIAIAFISFGSLVAPPFGGFLYQVAGKEVPFIFLALICLADAIMVFIVIHPKIRKTESGERIQGTPIWRLFMDPYIAICSGALIMANVSLAFIEPTIGKWMKDDIHASPFATGLVWLPAFIPHVIGVYLTIVLMQKYPQLPWLIAAGGMALEGISCFILPFCKSTVAVVIPLSILCFGIALIDTSILPLLGYLVDTRHVSVYGSIYAIADISYSLAYAFGPVIAGGVVAKMSFLALNIGICLSNLIYAPALALLRTVYQYRPFEGNEMNLIDGGGGGTGPGEYGSYDIFDSDGKLVGDSANQNYINGNPSQMKSGPKEHVEWKDTLYDRKMKTKNPYRGYKDTDAILGGEEEEEEEDEETEGYQRGGPPYRSHQSDHSGY